MAKYNIKSLNCITTGYNRNFINMDIQLDPTEYHLNDFVHLLAEENKHLSDFNNYNVLCGDILLDQKTGNYLTQNYISKEFNSISSELSSIELSCDLCALAKENSPEGMILNEVQSNYVEFSDNKANIYIRLYLSCCSDIEREKILEFKKTTNKNGKIFEVELNQIDGEKNDLQLSSGLRQMPIYDLNDVCIKSKNTIINNYLKNFDKSQPGKTEDIYFPDDAEMINMCQLGTNTYMVSKAITTSPTYAYSSLNKYSDAQTSPTGSYYNMDLRNKQLKTYMYPSKSFLSTILNDAKTASVNSNSDALAVYDMKSSSTIFSKLTTNNYFTPSINYKGINYNYIASFPMNNINNNSIGGLNSDYDNGNLYADMYIGKNYMNSLYSTEMSSINSLNNCRDYIDIIECGGKIFLKYYDNANYTSEDADMHSQLADLSVLQDMRTVKSPVKYPYQKIETFCPTKFKTNSRHKSFFFSVNIDDVDTYVDSENDSEQFKTNMEFLRHDITTAIKDIAQNVTPVQTQLFEVYFNQQ